MKKMAFLGWLIVFLPAILFAQERVEAPVWNIGDKWDFGKEGSAEVVGIEKNCYVLKFLGGIFLKSSVGTALFDKSTLNVLYWAEKGQPLKYKGARKRILNFPFNVGKKWRDEYKRKMQDGYHVIDFYENFRVLGWEDIGVRAGKFKAIKLEYHLNYSPPGAGIMGRMHADAFEANALYWYSPEVKYLIKCQHEKGYSEGGDELGTRGDWELTSFELKK